MNMSKLYEVIVMIKEDGRVISDFEFTFKGSREDCKHLTCAQVEQSLDCIYTEG